MVDLFCSWCEGLAYSEEALALIKDSSLFAGVEMANSGEETELIKKAGLKYSLHNPIRFFGEGLETWDLRKILSENPNVVSACNSSSLPFVGFHAGYSARLSKDNEADDILMKCKNSIAILKETITKEVIFENCSLSTTFFEKGNAFALNYCTSPDFFRALLEDSSVGFLLDVSHLVSAASTKIDKGIYSKGVEYYFSETINEFSGRINELHLNSTRILHNGLYSDAHLPIDIQSEEGRLTLCLAKEAVHACSNLKALTLEVDPKLPPVEHAKLLIKQAELVNKIVL
jgi:hypothetical protein